MKWYSVRSLFKSKLGGRTSTKKDMPSYFEERVVLFWARDFEDAMAKGAKEARKYQATYTNVFGEKVYVKYLGALDVFQLSSRPGNSVEIYSMTEVFKNDVGEQAYINFKLGKVLPAAKERALRQKFLNVKYSRN